MVLIDTSIFIEILRGHRMEDVEVLILDGQVLLSSIVHLELLMGVRKREEKLLREFLNAIGGPIPMPPIQVIEYIITKAKGFGLVGSLPDAIILADVVSNKVSLMSCDQKLLKLAKRIRVPVRFREDL